MYTKAIATMQYKKEVYSGKNTRQCLVFEIRDTVHGKIAIVKWLGNNYYNEEDYQKLEQAAK